MFSPLSHKNKDLRKQIKCFRNDMPFPHAVDKQSLLKEELPFFPIQFCQMLKRSKKKRRKKKRGNLCSYGQKTTTRRKKSIQFAV